MLTVAIRQFLQQPHIARLATLDVTGYPHIVPIWYLLDGDDVLFGTERHNHKVHNILRHPQAAVAIGGEPVKDGEGYLLQGEITIEEDPGYIRTRQLVERYEAPDDVEHTFEQFANGDTVFLRLRPKKIIRVY